jgi:hypothetical protein
LRWHRPIILLGKIDVVAKQGLNLDQRFSQARKPTGETTIKLPQCGGRLGRRHCIDEITHGFRLNQVEFAVEYCSPGELAGGGRPGPRSMECRKQPTGYQEPTVAGQLHEIFPGVAVGPGKDEVHAPVDSVPIQVPEAGKGRPPGGLSLKILNDLGGHVERPRPTETNHRKRGAAGWGCEGGNRIRQHRGITPSAWLV